MLQQGPVDPPAGQGNPNPNPMRKQSQPPAKIVGFFSIHLVTLTLNL
jgi:hypothetical protein